MKALLAGLLLIVHAGAAARTPMPPVDPSSYYIVPLVELVADPLPWVGYRMEVTGYLAEHGNLFLFLTSEHAKVGATDMAIMVANEFKAEPPLKVGEEYEDTIAAACGNSFVRVAGEWQLRPPGEFVLGRIKRIFKLEGSGGYCWGRYGN